MACGTILVSRNPFTMEQLTTIDKLAKELGYEVALSPVMTIDPNLVLAAEGKTSEIEKTVPYNLKPSTDDCPFFFSRLSIRPRFLTRLFTQADEQPITSILPWHCCWCF